MYIKILGYVMVIISSTATGFYYALKDSFRASDLKQIKKALGILGSEIEFARTPLPEALKNISLRIDKPMSDIFAEAAKKLGETDNPGVYEVWKASFNNFKTKMSLTAEDIENINSFGKTLGYLDKSMQLKGIAMLIEYINDKTSLLNEMGAKNKKMYSSLGLLCGLLICVIFM